MQSSIYTIPLPVDPLNQAVDDIHTQARAAEYKGTKLLASAERGLFIGNPETGLIGYKPEPDETPALRTWDVMQTGLDESVDLFSSEWECSIYLYVYFFSIDGLDIQAWRSNFMRLLFRRLATPNGNRPDEAFLAANIHKSYYTRFGIWPPVSGRWLFTPNQQPTIEHTNVFKDIGREVPMDRFWYASRMRLDITTAQTDEEDNEEV